MQCATTIPHFPWTISHRVFRLSCVFSFLVSLQNNFSECTKTTWAAGIFFRKTKLSRSFGICYMVFIEILSANIPQSLLGSSSAISKKTTENLELIFTSNMARNSPSSLFPPELTENILNHSPNFSRERGGGDMKYLTCPNSPHVAGEGRRWILPTLTHLVKTLSSLTMEFIQMEILFLF